MSVRAFLAVFPSVSLVGALGGVQRVLGEAMPPRGLRPVPPSNWHVTLRFLGHLRDEQLGAIADIADAAALAHDPCEVRTGGLTYLPNQHRARVVALEVDSGGALEALAADLNAGLEAAGFGGPDHPFNPHLTIARLRRQLRNLPHPDQVEPPVARFQALEFGLYRSVTAEEGARYSLLRRFALGDRALLAGGVS